MSNKREMDIRVVDLIKISNAPFPKSEDIYACLGHFDLIKIRELNRDDDSVFKAIWDDSTKIHSTDGRYVYPLYILHQQKSDELNKFWDRKFPCLFISRIHCEWQRAINEVKKELMESIYDLGSQQQPTVGDLSVEINGQPVHCTFYQTLELGDVAVIMKSNSLTACLQVSKRLMENEIVGDVYSYCGLYGSLVTESKLVEKCMPFGNFGEVYSGLSQKNPMASTRFSIKSARLATPIWKILGIDNEIHFVTGTADAIVDLSNKTGWDLIGLIQRLCSESTVEGSTPKYIPIQDAFDDVVTRVGIQYDEVYRKAKAAEKVLERKKLDQKNRQNAAVQLEEIEAKLKEKQYDWMFAFVTQMQTLLTMMDNCVLDDLSLLIWPSIRAFICRLHRVVCREERKLYNENIYEIEVFIDGWATLSNDIMHLESQLVQDPTLQASRVYVPAALLSYYMAFLSKLNELLYEIENKGASEAKESFRQYHPLIAHSIGLRANTLCVLDPTQDMTEDTTNECALLVSLPISLMYCPADITAVLCHEYLHYAGESTRLREKRFKCIMSSCAGYVLNQWDLEIGNKSNISLNDFEQALDFLKRKIENNCHNIDPTAWRYIHKMECVLPEALEGICLNWEIQSSFLTKFSKYDELKENFIRYASLFTAERQQADIMLMEERLKNLLLLYRECYADVAAILCLNLDVLSYIESILHHELVVRGKGEYKSPQLQKLAAQAAVVCLAVWPDLNPREDIKGRPEDEKWIDCVRNYVETIKVSHPLRLITDKSESWKTEQIGQKSRVVLSPSEYVPLRQYLTDCVEKIQLSFEVESVKTIRNELREMYDLISGEYIDLVSFQTKINQYRKKTFESN